MGGAPGPSRHHVPVWRAVGARSHAQLERDEPVPEPMARVILLRTGAAEHHAEDLGGQGREQGGSAGEVDPACHGQLQGAVGQVRSCHRGRRRKRSRGYVRQELRLLSSGPAVRQSGAGKLDRRGLNDAWFGHSRAFAEPARGAERLLIGSTSQVERRRLRSAASPSVDAQVRFQSRRFLPFKECCEWVRRNFGFLSRDEWEEWVSQGEGLSPYIPTRPDEFYSRLGQWRGWGSFFLRGIEDADDDPGAGSVIS